MTALWVRGRAGLLALHWLWAAMMLPAAVASPAIADEPITVRIDQARILKLPERAATVVIGNPLIADLSIQPGGLAIVTGKGYGATNVLVMDRSGAVLAEHVVEVKGPPDRIVVVYRGVARNTYSCTPECAPRITLGDDSDYFDKTLNQASTRNTQALAAGASTGH
jgi:putative type II/III system pilus formation protein